MFYLLLLEIIPWVITGEDVALLHHIELLTSLSSLLTSTSLASNLPMW